MSKKKILVVDDSITTLQFVSDTLTKAGYIVETAKDIWIAPKVMAMKPDLIMMDVNICRSKRNGPMAVSVLKKKSIGQQTTIVLYSSTKALELQEIADKCGADGYIPKSSNPIDLIRNIESYLSNNLRMAIR